MTWRPGRVSQNRAVRTGRQLSGLLAFAILLLISVAAAWEQQPHGHRAASAAEEVFSAGRAFRTVEAIASRPHPVGTAEHDRVRDHLVAELRKLGLETEIQPGIGRYPAGIQRDVLGMGRAENIVARLPGTHATGTVYLAAHYDSVPSGPGANDDGVGVATIVETVRALRASRAELRNDLVVLLTDAEEPGLFGAEAFIADGRQDRRPSVVINHEARGAGGVPQLWRLTHPDGTLIDAVAHAAPRPNADSLSTTLGEAQAGSSNTDYAALEPSGLRVLDWAYAGRSAYYHNRFDDPAHVDLATMQQLGENSLAQAREFGNRDLAVADEPDRSYFTLPFGLLVVTPVWVTIVLAVLALLATGWVVRQVRRSGEASVPRVLGAAATAFVAIPAAMAAVYGLWEAVLWLRPDYRPLFVDPYRPEFYYVAMLVLAAAVLLAWWVLARRIFGASAAAVGMLCCVTLLGVVITALAPVAGQAVVVPGVAAAIGVALTFLLPDRWRLPVLTVFLLPAAIFLGSTWTALQAGVAAAPFLVAPIVAVLGGLVTLTLAHTWPVRRSWPIPVLAVVLAAALAAAGIVVDRADDAHPDPVQLIYALDADRGEAAWLSRNAPARWTRDFVADTAPAPRFADLGTDMVASGPAAAQAIPAPTAQILSDTTDSGQRTVRLRLRSARGATSLELRFDTPIQTLRVSGREVTPVPAKGFRFYAPPQDGVEVEFTAAAGPLPLRLFDYTWLPDSGVEAYRNPPGDIYFRQDSSAIVFVSVPL